jgi:hypothetical protein
MEILIILIIMTIISVAACRWANRSAINMVRSQGQRPEAKVIKLSREVEESLSLEYEIIQSC